MLSGSMCQAAECSTCVACRGIHHDLDKGGQRLSPEMGSQNQRPGPGHHDLYGHEELWDNELIQLAPTLQARNALRASQLGPLGHYQQRVACFTLLSLQEMLSWPARPGCCRVTPDNTPPVGCCSCCSSAGRCCIPAEH